jgi:protein-tyrosine-phosphatase
MKILFVCWANVGRSQMAAALYNKQTGKNDADSAGTDVDVYGETLLERRNRLGGTYTIDVMRTEGIDVSNSRRTQLSKAMLKDYDLVISMAQKEYTPDWLADWPTYQYWDVKDPGGNDFDATNRALSEIKPKISSLTQYRIIKG